MQAKRAFERYANGFNVKIKHYHADNGIFAEAEFATAVQEDGQTISYCGVNAHHQNGRAEKKIRDLQDLARTMILHAQQRWSTAITVNLWPYAVRMANDVTNNTPSIKGGVSPIELFAQVAVAPRVKHSHTFGSPVYVLDSALQTAGRRIPKWDKRARIGIYLGTSPRHSRKVALVLSLQTGHVSPQFHVVFDDMFETLRPSAGNVLPESKWQEATGFTPSRTSTTKGKLNHAQKARTVMEGQGIIPPTEVNNIEWVNNSAGMVQDPQTGITGHMSDEENDRPATNENVEPEVDTTEQASLESRATENNGDGDTARYQQPADPFITTRSGRVSRPTARWKESQQQQRDKLVALHVSWEVYHDDGYQIEDELDDPIAFVASANPDIMYLDQAMKEADSKQFEKAMVDEVRAHTDNGHWVVRRRAHLSKGTKVLPAVWAMRRKRRITTGEPYKMEGKTQPTWRQARARS